MNYRHAYHAGNFADVLKHIVLIALLNALSRKETPYCYLDTHAGDGVYDLSSLYAEKTKEYADGITKVRQRDNPPSLVQQYLDCVHHINHQRGYATLHDYPGSPLIAQHVMRPQDRLVLCELQADAYQALKQTVAGDKRTAVHQTDGFLGLKAFLPPREKRGLILIDPPYEQPDEFTRIAKTLPTAIKRFETGVYAIWYPIKEMRPVERFYRAIQTHLSQPAVTIELTLYPDLPNHLNGCGMVIINPPWQLTETLKETGQWLWKTLTINNQGRFFIHPLQNAVK